jgi:hypothetical protein
MRSSSFHLAAGFGTALITAALAASVTWLHSGILVEAGPNLAEMEAIEASLAYKKSDPTKKQPQKKFRAPEPEEKPEGVSRDETKTPLPPEDKKEDKRKPDESFEDQYKKFQRDNDDEDLEVGKPTDDVGEFDGSKFGWAEESKGDPYFQAMTGELHSGWSFPEILAGTGQPGVCVRMSPDGKVIDTLFKEKSGDNSLDDSVERALAEFKQRRNQAPVPVPTHLLRAATTGWICFRFKL